MASGIMILITWVSVAYILSAVVKANVLTGKDTKLCPRLNLDKLPSVLTGCVRSNSDTYFFIKLFVGC